MQSLNYYLESLEIEIKQLDLPNEPNNLYDPLRYFLDLGGKRIRPILTLLAGKLFEADPKEAMNAAIAVELFHNFTLIHDDIMDNAPLRRNKKTVHEKWNTNIGILSGDVLFVKAYEFLGNCPKEHLKNLFFVFTKTAKEVCEGQQMDMDFETREVVSEIDYLEMIRLKTSVLLGCALEMGAILGVASEEDQRLVYKFGEQLGIAFQIQDDILDLFGNPEKVGKQLGGDVICNKKTLLSISAKNIANELQLVELLALESEENHEYKVNRTKELYLELRVKEKCVDHMKKHYEIAMNALTQINSTQSKKELIDLADFLFHREH